MKLITSIFFIVLVSGVLSAQTLDEILEKHFEAAGTKYLENVETIQFKGFYYNRFLEKMSGNLPEKLLKPDFILSLEKAKSYRLQMFSDPGNFITGFYEGNYWINQNGNIDAKWNPGTDDRRIIQQAIDLEGFLYNWKKKGYKAINCGEVVLNRKKYHKIQLINAEKASFNFYLDAKTFLVSFISFEGDLEDEKEHSNVEFLDYKKVGKISFPFKRIHTERMLDGGFGKKDIVIKEVLLNPKFDKEFFKPDYKN